MRQVPVTGEQFDKLVADGVDLGVYFDGAFTPTEGTLEDLVESIFAESEEVAAEYEAAVAVNPLPEDRLKEWQRSVDASLNAIATIVANLVPSVAPVQALDPKLGLILQHIQGNRLSTGTVCAGPLFSALHPGVKGYAQADGWFIQPGHKLGMLDMSRKHFAGGAEFDVDDLPPVVVVRP